MSLACNLVGWEVDNYGANTATVFITGNGKKLTPKNVGKRIGAGERLTLKQTEKAVGAGERLTLKQTEKVIGAGEQLTLTRQPLGIANVALVN